MSPLLIAALVLSAPAPAEDFGAARAKALAPYIDEQTIAVVRVDLSKIDPDALIKLLRDLGAMDAEDEKALKPGLAQWLTAFKKAGGRDVNYVISLSDLGLTPPEPGSPDKPSGGEPFVVVPLSEGADAKALAGLLPAGPMPNVQREKVGKALVAGSEATLARLRKLKPADRPELAKAFTAAGDGATQAVFLPAPQLVKLIDEHVPELPKELGGGSTKPFTQGVQWAALGLDAPPKVAVRFTVQSPSADDAKSLDESATALLKLLAADKSVRAALPGFEKVVGQLTPSRAESRLVLSLDDKQARAALAPVVRGAVASAARVQATNNLHQLVLACHNHNDTYGALPAVASFDKAGKPLLSWRVHLLPFLDEDKLYKEFHLDEPWDSDHNKKLIAKMPAVFRGANHKLNEQGKTVFLAPTGKGTAWAGPVAARIPASFPDGTSNTILFVLADDAHAVEWTKPDDLKIDPAKPHAGLGQRGGKFLVGLADGSARSVSPEISKETLRNAFDPADGNPLGDDW